jgi:tripartite-type tricarboxylate transporter receptor subunit TctC
MKLAVSLAYACCALTMAQGVCAQGYPAKPIRFIVPFPPGGPTDTHSRWAAHQLNTALEKLVRA